MKHVTIHLGGSRSDHMRPIAQTEGQTVGVTVNDTRKHRGDAGDSTTDNAIG
ncbi:hypothetical protein SK355_09485 [Candidatus Fukatsuia symbiotica]|uniref:hypothetical protein n=1 Tax=Candidatus Fukatsuia TaxID=1927833 RepID=UPI001F07FA18|nr:hypothetical protein [Candidatus Fukatsuia symbiotica]MEA9445450.1 hypothetical protein [Candidatus Fukatsuia symbiotica]